jgi:hypothetical protein
MSGSTDPRVGCSFLELMPYDMLREIAEYCFTNWVTFKSLSATSTSMRRQCEGFEELFVKPAMDLQFERLLCTKFVFVLFYVLIKFFVLLDDIK